jgi:hypothetical protein
VIPFDVRSEYAKLYRQRTEERLNTGLMHAQLARASPEAGTTKTKTARKVPIHEHLIEQGFIDFVRANGKGALFYNDAKQPAGSSDPTKYGRSFRYTQLLDTFLQVY